MDGDEILADAVVVTVDTLSAIDNLFDEPLHEKWMDMMRECKTFDVFIYRLRY